MATIASGAGRSRRQASVSADGLKRDVGVFGLTVTSLGSVIGSGWLLGALYAAQAAGPASLISWGIAGAIVVTLALVYAELGAAYPMSGGPARYPHVALGPLSGFTAGWMAWLGTVTLAPIEVEAALQYVTPKITFIPALTSGSSDSVKLTAMGYLVAAVLMALFTAVNVVGVKAFAESSGTIVVWKTIIPVLTLIVLMVLAFHGSNFSSTAPGGFAPFGAKGVLTALPAGVVFSLTGFEQAAQLGGESRNPGRDLPRAVVGSMLIGVVVYTLLQVALIGSFSPHDLAKGWGDVFGDGGQFGPYATLATALGAGWLATLLYIDAFVSPAGTGLIYVGTSSRVSYSLDRSRYVQGLGSVSRRGVPWTNVLLSFAVGMVVFLPFPGWHSLVGFITSASALMFAFAPLSVAALRRNDRERTRPYTAPGGRVLPPIAFAASALIFYWSGWEVVWKLLAALGIGLVVVVGAWGVARLRGSDAPLPAPLRDLRGFVWLAPFLAGMGVLSYVGQFKGGREYLPFWWDIVTVVVFSLVIFAFAQRQALAPDRVAEVLAAEEEASAATEKDLA